MLASMQTCQQICIYVNIYAYMLTYFEICWHICKHIRIHANIYMIAYMHMWQFLNEEISVFETKHRFLIERYTSFSFHSRAGNLWPNCQIAFPRLPDWLFNLWGFSWVLPESSEEWGGRGRGYFQLARLRLKQNIHIQSFVTSSSYFQVL